MKKEKLKKMFANLCCSECHADFEEESFLPVRTENELFVVQVVCPKCGKSFGMAMLGCKPDMKEQKPLEIVPSPVPISQNEVLDAHNFIKNLDEKWMDHVPKDFTN